jgi:predicted O-methyltransferase YrrM
MSECQDLKDYFNRQFCQEDDVLNFVRSDSRAQGMPEIQIPAYVGKFLYLMAKIQGAQKILEIGTLGGYSTLWLGRAIQETGKLLSLEINPLHVKVARHHIEKAKMSHCVEIRCGHGVELLAQIDQAKEGPFDLVFIDADKENNALYFDWAVHLCRPGSLIIIDNIIPKGPKIGEPGNKEAVSIYTFNEFLAKHPSVEVVPIPTLSRDRLDGMALARVL